MTGHFIFIKCLRSAHKYYYVSERSDHSVRADFKEWRSWKTLKCWWLEHFVLIGYLCNIYSIHKMLLIEISFILTIRFHLFRFIFLADAFSEGFIENAYIKWQLLEQVANNASQVKFRPPVPGMITRSWCSKDRTCQETLVVIKNESMGLVMWL